MAAAPESERTLRSAIWPMAVAPPALIAALLTRAPLDPMAPLRFAPASVVVLLLLAAAAPAVTIFTTRRAIESPLERNRVLTTGAGLGIAATLVAAGVASVLARPLLVRGGGAWILLAACAAALAALASFVTREPRSLFRWGLFAGEAAVALVTVSLLRSPRAPDEYLRHAMTVEPGWGATNLGTLATLAARRALADDPDERRELRARAIEGTLAAMIEHGAFAPPFVAWGDDARIVRAFAAGIAAQSPSIADEDAAAYARTSIVERLLFAESPEAKLEPFTRAGILGTMAIAETDGLGADVHVRLRVHTAWTAVERVATQVDDPELEARAIAAVRKLFADESLDRTHPIHLLTFSLERRRLVETGDAAGLIAFFDRLAADGTFPERYRTEFAREASFVRDHPEDGYKPVMLLLQARAVADGGYGDLPGAERIYREILAGWPEGEVAGIARVELASLKPAG